MAQTADKVMSRVNGAHANAADDDRNTTTWTGIRKEWSVDLVEFTATIHTDTNVEGLHIEKFTINGKWKSHVRKDRYALGVVADKQWGDDNRPYGNIELKIKAVDGGITSDVITTVDGFDDEPNQYARSKADALVRGILATIHEG